MTHVRGTLLNSLAIGIALCGAWISGELLRRHDDIWRLNGPGGGILGKLCDAGSRVGIDCQQTSGDPWSEIRVPKPGWRGRLTGGVARVPVPFLGLGYFTFVAVWFVCIGWPGRQRFLANVLPITVLGAGALSSIFLLGLMVTARARPCPPCILAHVLNGLLIVLAWRGWRGGRRLGVTDTDAASSHVVTRPSARHVFTALLFWAVLVAGCWIFRSEHLAMAHQWEKLLSFKQTVTALREDERFLVQQYLAQPVQPSATTKPAEGRPQLVVFIDYECPNCSCSLSAVIENARRAFPSLEVRVRQYPLCAECNPDVKGAFHEHACRAAYIAEAARLQGGDEAFWKMHKLLVERRGKVETAELTDLARVAGLDPQHLARDAQGETVRQCVATDIEAARQAGVSGTPSIFFEGRRVDPRFEGPTFWRSLVTRFGSATSAPAAGETRKVVSTQGGGA